MILCVFVITMRLCVDPILDKYFVSVLLLYSSIVCGGQEFQISVNAQHREHLPNKFDLFLSIHKLSQRKPNSKSQN